jgi:hypothetical protein
MRISIDSDSRLVRVEALDYYSAIFGDKDKYIIEGLCDDDHH